jgi:SsrA-binding protein
VQEKGYALIPLRTYLKRGKVKIELALARGKKKYDKRNDLAEKDAKREIERAFKDRQQYR